MDKEHIRFFTNFLLNDFQGLLKQAGKTIENCGISPEELGLVITAIEKGLITRYMGRELIKEWLRENICKV